MTASSQGSAAAQPAGPLTGRLISIECKYTSGLYPKLCKSKKRPRGLEFSNGRLGVTPAELEEIQASPYWGREIALRGQLSGGPGRAVKTIVRRPGESGRKKRK